MATMTRSKSQVIRGYLPGQAFQHANDTIVRVSNLSAGPADVNTELLVEMLDEKLAYWQRPGDGAARRSTAPRAISSRWPTPRPVRVPGARRRGLLRHLAADAALHQPRLPESRRVRAPGGLDRLQEAATQRAATSAARGASSTTTCSCTPAATTPPCPSGRARSRTSTATNTASRTSTCMTLGRSSPRRGAAATARATTGSSAGCATAVPLRRRPLPVRDSSARSDRFITQTFSSSLSRVARWCSSAPPRAPRRSSSAPTWSTSTDYEKALADAGKDRGDAQEKWKKMKAALEATGTAPEEIAAMRKLVLGESGGAFDEMVAARRRRERRPDIGSAQRAARTHADLRRRRRVAHLAARDVPPGRATGRPHAAAVHRLNDAETKLRDFGFSDLLVVENFPVALVAYGFTRLDRDPRAGDAARLPAAGRASTAIRRPLYIARRRPKRCSSSSTPSACSTGWSTTA